jgi:hypothetical protein
VRLDDENATLVLTFIFPNGTKIMFPAGLSKHGIIFFALQVPGYIPDTDFQLVPGTVLSVILIFKGVMMEPVSGPSPLVLDGLCDGKESCIVARASPLLCHRRLKMEILAHA